MDKDYVGSSMESNEAVTKKFLRNPAANYTTNGVGFCLHFADISVKFTRKPDGFHTIFLRINGNVSTHGFVTANKGMKASGKSL